MLIFPSTPSAWRVTNKFVVTVVGETISIHTLRVEGDSMFRRFGFKWLISIHTLRMEGDLCELFGVNPEWLFQSTPSAWRVTNFAKRVPVLEEISIHTLRMEGDSLSIIAITRDTDFNPHPPHGG